MDKKEAGKVALPSTRRGIRTFFAETAREMRKVHWPTPRETTNLTSTVLIVCAAIAVILLLMGKAAAEIVSILTGGSF